MDERETAAAPDAGQSAGSEYTELSAGLLGGVRCGARREHLRRFGGNARVAAGGTAVVD
ncbi:hypothetical protein ACFXPA_03705 [Amycolatopsis sp. NPDC059090]|uniref:hypothetical protein n=1 Tax=unclassified Amycolatopsis TaxID=2618356 RepID=UPI00366E8D36